MLIEATNLQLPRTLSNATKAKIASLKTQKDQKAAVKRAAPLKTVEKKKQKKSPANDAVEAIGIVDSSTVPSKSTNQNLGKLLQRDHLSLSNQAK